MQPAQRINLVPEPLVETGTGFKLLHRSPGSRDDLDFPFHLRFALSRVGYAFNRRSLQYLLCSPEPTDDQFPSQIVRVVCWNGPSFAGWRLQQPIDGQNAGCSSHHKVYRSLISLGSKCRQHPCLLERRRNKKKAQADFLAGCLGFS